MDLDFDYLSPVDSNEPFLPSQSLPTDSVKWQSSQVPCPVLKSLMSKSDLPRKEKILGPWRSSEPGPSKSSHLTASVTSLSASATRPLVRTNSRPRFGRYSEPDTRSPLQAPDLNIFNTGDSSQFLDLVKTVAERVDENAGFRAAKNEDVTGMKRKIRTSGSISAVDVNPRVRKGRLSAVAKDVAKVSRPRGINKEDSGTDPEHEDDSSGSFIPELPHLSSSSFTSASSSSLYSSSINTSVLLDIEAADASKSLSMSTKMDMDALDSSTSSHAHIAPLPKRRALSHTNSPSLNSATDLIPPDTRNTTSVNPAMSAPRLHPLLKQQHSRKQHPPPRGPQPTQPLRRVYPPPQRAHLPSASQTITTTRPPVLGMRRTPTTIATSHPTNIPLPTRQKAFKPPLQSQTQTQLHTHVPSRPLPSQPLQPNIRNLEKDNVQLAKTESSKSLWSDTSNNKEVPNHRPLTISEDNSSLAEAQSNSNPEADSSFGDMSFDIDALEETMRMYD